MKTKSIDGFKVEFLEQVRNGRVRFTARIIDLYVSGPSCTSTEEAHAALALKWESIKTAYLNSNLPIPRPIHRKNNQRIINTLRSMAKRPFPKDII